MGDEILSAAKTGTHLCIGLIEINCAVVNVGSTTSSRSKCETDRDESEEVSSLHRSNENELSYRWRERARIAMERIS
jgi:hypothetical protein